MKTVARMTLQPGMMLGEDVKDAHDKIIFPKSHVLTAPDIELLKRYSIMCVSILEEIDLADTHYEKLQYDNEFKAFQIMYLDTLDRFKKMLINFLQHGVLIEDNKLLPLYTNLRFCCQNEKKLLDYLYNLTPTEDLFTYSHLLNSALIAGVFSEWLQCSQTDKDLYILCAFYYDIGKLLLPEWLLWKTEKLSQSEFETMKNHTIMGFQAVLNTPLHPAIKSSILLHHEKMDGTGYPKHFKGDQIDKYSRFVAIVDNYEAMASPRTYRPSIHPLNIIKEFEKNLAAYDSEILLPLLNKVADSMLGTEIQLNDHNFYEVMILNKDCLSRPLVRGKNSEIINLVQHPELTII